MQKHCVWRIITGLLAVGAGLSIAQPALAQGVVPNTPGAVVLERILVKINGGLITQTDLEAAQINALRARGVTPQTDAALRQVIQEITPELMVNAVEELLLVQRGRELGYALSDEQYQDIVDELQEENNFNEEQLRQALQSEQGMTMAQLRDTLEKQMLVGQVQQVEILGRVSITDTEAREYYDENLEEFTEPATVTLQEILIAVPQEGGALNAARDSQARVEAEAAHARIVAGEDFGQVASEVSDAASKTNRGLIGPIDLADLNQSVRDRLEALEVGAVGEVERTAVGYQILKLESATQPTPRPFDDEREDIVNNVFSERRLRALEDYLTRLREEAIIEWNDETLHGLHDEYLANRDLRAGR